MLPWNLVQHYKGRAVLKLESLNCVLKSSSTVCMQGICEQVKHAACDYLLIE